MKKVQKVSIADISFTLDDDAYVALRQYLDSLGGYYRDDPDGREIIADIEARISELILEEQVYTKVVSKMLIDSIIAQLGTPDQIDDAAGEGSGANGNDGGGRGGMGAGGNGEACPGGRGAPVDYSLPRRLHRSAEGKILGGVCSGIARYLNIGVVWVRLAFLLPLVLRIAFWPFDWWWGMDDFFEDWSWVFFVVYIVLWIALPMARTPRQKLEARGERITPASIRHRMQVSASTPAGKKAASVAAELVTVLARVVLFFVKFVTAVVGFAFLFGAATIFMVMMMVLFKPDEVMINGVNVIDAFQGIAILTPVLVAELLLICSILPMLAAGLGLLAFTFGWRLGRLFFAVSLGVWGFAIIFLGIVAAGNARFLHDEFPYRFDGWDHHHHEYRWDRHDGWIEREPGRESGGLDDELREMTPVTSDTVTTRTEISLPSPPTKDSVTNRVVIRRVE